MKWVASLVLLVGVGSSTALAVGAPPVPPPADASIKITGELLDYNIVVPGDAYYKITVTYTLPIGATYEYWTDYGGTWTGPNGTYSGWGNRTTSLPFAIGIVSKELGGDPDATTKTFTQTWYEYVRPDTNTTCVRAGIQHYNVGTPDWFIYDMFAWIDPGLLILADL